MGSWTSHQIHLKSQVTPFISLCQLIQSLFWHVVVSQNSFTSQLSANSLSVSLIHTNYIQFPFVMQMLLVPWPLLYLCVHSVIAFVIHIVRWDVQTSEGEFNKRESVLGFFFSLYLPEWPPLNIITLLIWTLRLVFSAVILCAVQNDVIPMLNIYILIYIYAHRVRVSVRCETNMSNRISSFS